MSDGRMDKALSVILTVAAVVIAATIVYREFGAKGGGSAVAAGPEFVKDWVQLSSSGTRIGKIDAPIAIVEFADMECPFCKRFHESALKSAVTEFGDKIALIYVDFPIAGHRFAEPAARAAQCAGRQERFGPFLQAVYSRQDSLGLKTWQSYADDAGVRDTTAFILCTRQTAPLALVEAGKSAGKALNVRGTPTVIVNGWRYETPPTDSILLHAIRALLLGRSPRDKQS